MSSSNILLLMELDRSAPRTWAIGKKARRRKNCIAAIIRWYIFFIPRLIDFRQCINREQAVLKEEESETIKLGGFQERMETHRLSISFCSWPILARIKPSSDILQP